MNLTKLTSLTAQFINLQLLPCGESQGVLGAAVTPPLKRLRLKECFFKDETPQGLTAALALLPGLEYLSITGYANFPTVQEMAIRGDVLQQLPQLTYLELQHVWLVSALEESDGDVSDRNSDDGDSEGNDRYNLGLQHITALTRLADLRLLLPDCGCSILASMLSSAQPLTCLQLQTASWSGFCFESGVLAGKTLLQHLELRCCYIAGHAPGVVQLLSELQQLQQLTRLVLRRCWDESDAPAAAYSALTASSKLQHLDISSCSFPTGVWQHLFPVGRKPPHLQTLNISRLSPPLPESPDGTRLARCCPGLQSLSIQRLPCSKAFLAPLQGLITLTGLCLQPPMDPVEEWVETVEGVCQLIGCDG
jgi:hypothetical protein